MKRQLVRLLLATGGLALLGFAVAASGVIPIKASSGHWPVTDWFLRFSMKRSLATYSLGTDVPTDLGDERLVQKGAAHYELSCRSCHGEPRGPRPRVPMHMLPTPPDLAQRIPESSPRKLFEVVKHGVKFTGMPAWPAAARDDEVWAVVAFLLKYPDLGSDGYHALAGRDENLVATGIRPPAPSPPAVVRSCVRCHGADGLGRGNTLLPHLAGQHAEYLRGALRAYAADQRQSGIMEPVVAELSPSAIDEAADYYASLPPPAHPIPMPERKEAIRRGASIAREGIPGQRVPACFECHGPVGHRAKPEFPRLAGQPSDYLELQLRLFREDRRGGSDHAHLMQPIASRLTPAQARDVAQFLASLPPGESRPSAADAPER